MLDDDNVHSTPVTIFAASLECHNDFYELKVYSRVNLLDEIIFFKLLFTETYCCNFGFCRKFRENLYMRSNVCESTLQ